MIEKIRGWNRTLLELEMGIVLFGLAVQITGVWFAKDKVDYSAGIWLGILIAMWAAAHMAYVLNRAFSGPEEDVTKRMARGSVIRYVAIVLAYGAVVLSGAGNPVLAFIGIMGLKVAAYIQPFTHKFTNWIFHETDPVPEPLLEEETEQNKEEE
ncbi:MAG: hypothetical protein IJ282_01875 [Lachnospiraceae bacterium]|nr:hypothetical protein [Lachnospiraceae bacterium]